MALFLVKTGAIAAIALTMSVTGAFAATWGVVNYDTKVKKSWSSASTTLTYVDEGDEVQILDYTKKNGGWFKIKVPGPDGWVKKSAIDVYSDGPSDEEPSVNFCFTGPLGHVCVNS